MLQQKTKCKKVWIKLFNDTKCHHLHVNTMVAPTGEHDITKVDSGKDLGVTIDKNLNFREHISAEINLANRNLGSLF